MTFQTMTFQTMTLQTMTLQTWSDPLSDGGTHSTTQSQVALRD